MEWRYRRDEQCHQSQHTIWQDHSIGQHYEGQDKWYNSRRVSDNQEVAYEYDAANYRNKYHDAKNSYKYYNHSLSSNEITSEYGSRDMPPELSLYLSHESTNNGTAELKQYLGDRRRTNSTSPCRYSTPSPDKYRDKFRGKPYLQSRKDFWRKFSYSPKYSRKVDKVDRSRSRSVGRQKSRQDSNHSTVQRNYNNGLHKVYQKNNQYSRGDNGKKLCYNKTETRKNINLSYKSYEKRSWSKSLSSSPSSITLDSCDAKPVQSKVTVMHNIDRHVTSSKHLQTTEEVHSDSSEASKTFLNNAKLRSVRTSKSENESLLHSNEITVVNSNRMHVIKNDYCSKQLVCNKYGHINRKRSFGTIEKDYEIAHVHDDSYVSHSKKMKCNTMKEHKKLKCSKPILKISNAITSPNISLTEISQDHHSLNSGKENDSDSNKILFVSNEVVCNKNNLNGISISSHESNYTVCVKNEVVIDKKDIKNVRNENCVNSSNLSENIVEQEMNLNAFEKNDKDRFETEIVKKIKYKRDEVVQRIEMCNSDAHIVKANLEIGVSENISETDLVNKTEYEKNEVIQGIEICNSDACNVKANLEQDVSENRSETEIVNKIEYERNEVVQGIEMCNSNTCNVKADLEQDVSENRSETEIVNKIENEQNKVVQRSDMRNTNVHINEKIDIEQDATEQRPEIEFNEIENKGKKVVQKSEMCNSNINLNEQTDIEQNFSEKDRSKLKIDKIENERNEIVQRSEMYNTDIHINEKIEIEDKHDKMLNIINNERNEVHLSEMCKNTSKHLGHDFECKVEQAVAIHDSSKLNRTANKKNTLNNLVATLNLMKQTLPNTGQMVETIKNFVDSRAHGNMGNSHILPLKILSNSVKMGNNDKSCQIEKPCTSKSLNRINMPEEILNKKCSSKCVIPVKECLEMNKTVHNDIRHVRQSEQMHLIHNRKLMENSEEVKDMCSDFNSNNKSSSIKIGILESDDLYLSKNVSQYQNALNCKDTNDQSKLNIGVNDKLGIAQGISNTDKLSGIQSPSLNVDLFGNSFKGKDSVDDVMNKNFGCIEKGNIEIDINQKPSRVEIDRKKIKDVCIPLGKMDDDKTKKDLIQTVKKQTSTKTSSKTTSSVVKVNHLSEKQAKGSSKEILKKKCAVEQRGDFSEEIHVDNRYGHNEKYLESNSIGLFNKNTKHISHGNKNELVQKSDSELAKLQHILPSVEHRLKVNKCDVITDGEINVQNNTRNADSVKKLQYCHNSMMTKTFSLVDCAEQYSLKNTKNEIAIGNVFKNVQASLTTNTHATDVEMTDKCFVNENNIKLYKDEQETDLLQKKGENKSEYQKTNVNGSIHKRSCKDYVNEKCKRAKRDLNLEKVIDKTTNKDHYDKTNNSKLKKHKSHCKHVKNSKRTIIGSSTEKSVDLESQQGRRGVGSNDRAYKINKLENKTLIISKKPLNVISGNFSENEFSSRKSVNCGNLKLNENNICKSETGLLARKSDMMCKNDTQSVATETNLAKSHVTSRMFKADIPGIDVKNSTENFESKYENGYRKEQKSICIKKETTLIKLNSTEPKNSTLNTVKYKNLDNFFDTDKKGDKKLSSLTMSVNCTILADNKETLLNKVSSQSCEFQGCRFNDPIQSAVLKVSKQLNKSMEKNANKETPMLPSHGNSPFFYSAFKKTPLFRSRRATSCNVDETTDSFYNTLETKKSIENITAANNISNEATGTDNFYERNSDNINNNAMHDNDSGKTTCGNNILRKDTKETDDQSLLTQDIGFSHNYIDKVLFEMCNIKTTDGNSAQSVNELQQNIDNTVKICTEQKDLKELEYPKDIADINEKNTDESQLNFSVFDVHHEQKEVKESEIITDVHDAMKKANDILKENVHYVLENKYSKLNSVEQKDCEKSEIVEHISVDKIVADQVQNIPVLEDIGEMKSDSLDYWDIDIDDIEPLEMIGPISVFPCNEMIGPISVFPCNEMIGPISVFPCNEMIGPISVFPCNELMNSDKVSDLKNGTEIFLKTDSAPFSSQQHDKGTCKSNEMFQVNYCDDRSVMPGVSFPMSLENNAASKICVNKVALNFSCEKNDIDLKDAKNKAFSLKAEKHKSREMQLNYSKSPTHPIKTSTSQLSSPRKKYYYRLQDLTKGFDDDIEESVGQVVKSTKKSVCDLKADSDSDGLLFAEMTCHKQTDVSNKKQILTDPQQWFELAKKQIKVLNQNSIFDKGFEVCHIKILINLSEITTFAHLEPKKLYVNGVPDKLSKCLLCKSCSMYFTPLEFTLHHDSSDVVAVIDLEKSQETGYSLKVVGDQYMEQIFNDFLRFFNDLKNKKTDGSPLKFPKCYAETESNDNLSVNTKSQEEVIGETLTVHSSQKCQQLQTKTKLEAQHQIANSSCVTNEGGQTLVSVIPINSNAKGKIVPQALKQNTHESSHGEAKNVLDRDPTTCLVQSVVSECKTSTPKVQHFNNMAKHKSNVLKSKLYHKIKISSQTQPAIAQGHLKGQKTLAQRPIPQDSMLRKPCNTDANKSMANIIDSKVSYVLDPVIDCKIRELCQLFGICTFDKSFDMILLIRHLQMRAIETMHKDSLLKRCKDKMKEDAMLMATVADRISLEKERSTTIKD